MAPLVRLISTMSVPTNRHHQMAMMLVVMLVVTLVVMLVMAVPMSSIQLRQQLARGWQDCKCLACHESCWWRPQSRRRIGKSLPPLRRLRLYVLLCQALWSGPWYGQWLPTLDHSGAEGSPTCGVRPVGFDALLHGYFSFGRHPRINLKMALTVRSSLHICSLCFFSVCLRTRA